VSAPRRKSNPECKTIRGAVADGVDCAQLGLTLQQALGRSPDDLLASQNMPLACIIQSTQVGTGEHELFSQRVAIMDLRMPAVVSAVLAETAAQASPGASVATSRRS
jgi:hypothetical protein